MGLLTIPIEIRLRVYSELLVQDGPVHFGAIKGLRNPSLIRSRRHSLSPALLRVNKAISRETIPLLYSRNRSRFPDAYISNMNTSVEPEPGSAWDTSDGPVPYIGPFLRQIGPNASFLRHICINFPAAFASSEPLVLHKKYTEVFQLIRETCTDLRTVEISSESSEGIILLLNVDLAEKMLRALDDGCLKDIPSLEKIVVVHARYNIDEEVIASCENLMQKMPSIKWFIELTTAPPSRWISNYGQVEFDNADDCFEYDLKRERIEWKGREEQEWEELDRRRNNPYYHT
ncbi:hypothetical protein F4678DRAFT_461967 [Xylaria arbuscula]|nr:hypothetical protein F4678DRAFT_461967 [Xylaria arbuscula]